MVVNGNLVALNSYGLWGSMCYQGYGLWGVRLYVYHTQMVLISISFVKYIKWNLCELDNATKLKYINVLYSEDHPVYIIYHHDMWEAL